MSARNHKNTCCNLANYFQAKIWRIILLVSLFALLNDTFSLLVVSTENPISKPWTKIRHQTQSQLRHVLSNKTSYHSAPSIMLKIYPFGISNRQNETLNNGNKKQKTGGTHITINTHWMTAVCCNNSRLKFKGMSSLSITPEIRNSNI